MSWEQASATAASTQACCLPREGKNNPLIQVLIGRKSLCLLKSLPTGQALLQALLLVIMLETGCAKHQSLAQRAECRQVWKLNSPSGTLPSSRSPSIRNNC